MLREKSDILRLVFVALTNCIIKLQDNPIKGFGHGVADYIIRLHHTQTQSHLFRGAGGSRTLVQTSSRNAFYMLSFLVVFEHKPEKSALLMP